VAASFVVEMQETRRRRVPDAARGVLSWLGLGSAAVALFVFAVLVEGGVLLLIDFGRCPIAD
jgi:hypothetical protein